jgi:integrase
MNTATTTNGSRIAIETIEDLLNAIQEQTPTQLLAMFRTTVGHVANFLNTPVKLLQIAALSKVDCDFRKYLRQRRYSVNTVRAYSNYSAILLRKAKELGWVPRQPEIPDAWKAVVEAFEKAVLRPRKDLVTYAIANAQNPAEFGDNEMRTWREAMIGQGGNCDYIDEMIRRFRFVVLNAGLAERFPRLTCTRRYSVYGVPLHSFPAKLRTEVEMLLKWKQDPFAPGRPRGGRIRPVTARYLGSTITRLYGFVRNVEGREPSRLLKLVTEPSMVSFVTWSLNDRKLDGTSFAGHLSVLYATLRHYPAYKDQNFSWLGELIAQIPRTLDSAISERKARKYVPYGDLAEIPGKMREERVTAKNLSSRQIAILAHDELLISFLLTLVWRQRNLRECRINSLSGKANLFKEELPPLVTFAIPGWAENLLKSNPNEQLWQFRFSEDGTKMGNQVRSVLPRRLVPLLEEYLQHHRPALLNGLDPGTLFLNRSGGHLTPKIAIDYITSMTLRYVSKKVNPHLFRDIFAFFWLDAHPEDYLTLSKMLWHKNINTTLRRYGRRFDESHGLRKVEEWLDRTATM